MARTMPQRLPGVEVNRVDPALIEIAKAGVGLAIKEAIGDSGLKSYGDKGQMSKVVTGEKVPKYWARIFQNPIARRRLVRALARDIPGVRVRVVIEWEEGCLEIS